MHHLLKRFGNAKRLSLVARRHGDRFPDAALMDLIDFDKPLDLIGSQVAYRNMAKRFLLPIQAQVEIYRQQNLNPSGQPKYPMPQIDLKMVTTRSLKESYESLAPTFEPAKILWANHAKSKKPRLGVDLQFKDLATYHFYVSATTTISVLENKLRDRSIPRWRLFDGKRLEVFSDGIQIDKNAFLGDLDLIECLDGTDEKITMDVYLK